MSNTACHPVIDHDCNELQAVSNAHAKAYARCLVTPDQASALIPSGARVVIGMAVSQPPAVCAAIARTAREGALTGIELYYYLSTKTAAETVLRPELSRSIHPVSLFYTEVERTLELAGAKIDFIPCAFSASAEILSDIVDPDVLITTVSPMDEHGYFSLGTNVDYSLAVSRTAKIVILEVNPAMPRVRGDCQIHISRVNAIVEHYQPLIEIPPARLRPEDEEIGKIVAGLIRDGDCLQMGIGAVPQAVCSHLVNHRHLGIHSELMSPGLAELIKRGVVDNSRKAVHRGKSVYTLAMGDREFYDYLNDHPDIEAYPVDYLNNPALIMQNPNAVSVNATLQIDLDGACNSEAVSGQLYSGSGGQLDFVRGAVASKGGRSIVACHSTAAGGQVSKIVSRLDGPVTNPRNDAHIFVTEFGAVNLRGKSLRQRAQALIGIAHPKFRDDLSRELADRFKRSAKA